MGRLRYAVRSGTKYGNCDTSQGGCRQYRSAPLPRPFHRANSGTVRRSVGRFPAARTMSRVVVEKPFGRDLASARATQRHATHRIRRNHESSRNQSLPRQGGGAQPRWLFRFAKHVPRTNLEPPATSKTCGEFTMAGERLRRGRTRRVGVQDAAPSVTSCRGVRCLSLCQVAIKKPPAEAKVQQSMRDEQVENPRRRCGPLGPTNRVRGQFRGYRQGARPRSRRLSPRAHPHRFGGAGTDSGAHRIRWRRPRPEVMVTLGRHPCAGQKRKCVRFRLSPDVTIGHHGPDGFASDRIECGPPAQIGDDLMLRASSTKCQ